MNAVAVNTVSLPTLTAPAPWYARLGVSQRPWSLLVAAGSLWLAASIHLVLTMPHFRWWLPAGVFFATMTVVQMATALALLAPTKVTTLMTSIATNLVVIVVYIVSRTAGIPGQPGITAHGTPRAPGVPIIEGALEKVGSNDLVSLGAELVVVMICAAHLPDRFRSKVINGLLLVGLTLMGLASVGILA